MKPAIRISTLAVTSALAGCSNLPMNTPLFFGETVSVGISASTSTTDQGMDLTLGFKSKDVAVVPVVTFEGGTQENSGKSVPLRGEVSEGATTNRDAYSVIGQFSTTTDDAGKRIGLGKFFATGQAALQLSEGFKNSLSQGGSGQQAPATPGTQPPASP